MKDLELAPKKSTEALCSHMVAMRTMPGERRRKWKERLLGLC
jgi:hypothetical protein